MAIPKSSGRYFKVLINVMLGENHFEVTERGTGSPSIKVALISCRGIY